MQLCRGGLTVHVLNVPSHIASVAFGVQDSPLANHRRRAAARRNRTAPPHLLLVGVCAVLLEPHAVVVHTRPALRFRRHHAPPVPRWSWHLTKSCLLGFLVQKRMCERKRLLSPRRHENVWYESLTLLSLHVCLLIISLIILFFCFF